MGSHFFDIVQNLLDPLHFMLLASLYLPGAILSLLLKLDVRALFSWERIKEAWFARFWAVYGPLSREGATGNVKPLVEAAYGVVLDIGPGGGEWVHLYDKEKVTKIYGVEPNRDLHGALRRKVKEAGLSDIYVVVAVGVGELGEEWVRRREVDCVVTIQCLCSIPTPEKMIKSLYGYLKEGGRWIVYEHVVTHQGGWVAKYQALVDVIWPTFLGGCSITRDSEKTLREVGSWSVVELSQPSAEPYYKVLPHLMGYLKK